MSHLYTCLTCLFKLKFKLYLRAYPIPRHELSFSYILFQTCKDTLKVLFVNIATLFPTYIMHILHQVEGQFEVTAAADSTYEICFSNILDSSRKLQAISFHIHTDDPFAIKKFEYVQAGII